MAANGLELGADSSRVHKNENYVKRASEHYSKFVETIFRLFKELGLANYNSNDLCWFVSGPGLNFFLAWSQLGLS